MFTESQIANIFRKKGFKATPQRIAIARTVLASKEHPTAERVYKEVSRFYPTVSLSTVYKTLHILKELDMLQELAFDDYGVRFDPNIKPHVNLICINCGEIEDAEDYSLREIINKVSERTGFKMVRQRFDAYGYCRKCAGRIINPRSD